MKTCSWHELDNDGQAEALKRPSASSTAISMAVGAILQQVKQRGDEAVVAYTAQFDGVRQDIATVPQADLNQAFDALPAVLRSAMETASANITTFHNAQKQSAVEIETQPGVKLALQWRPIRHIGLYVPGGSAPLFSSVLMQAIPAKLAGCERIVLCAPPQPTGEIHPYILAAAKLCGISEIYAAGGAQAIAAMAYGTATITKVDKIFGPGNVYVTHAKEQVAREPGGPAIDMPAGPSEVMVIASAASCAPWVAADLLAQAEHDADAQVLLVSTSQDLLGAVLGEIEAQLQTLPRKTIAAASLKNARAIFVEDLTVAAEVANLYAPEHLILADDEAKDILPLIQNAGAIFVGAYAPETAGDYASGGNHVLPTNGHARSYSGLTFLSFMKATSVQTISKAGLQALAPTLIALAEAESLDAHARAVRCRLEAL